MRLSNVFLILTLIGNAAVADKLPEPLGPGPLVLAPDGSRLFVAEADGRQIDVVDLNRREVIGSISTGASPTGLVLDPGGAMLYVTCVGPKGAVHAIDVTRMKIAFTLVTGHTPIAPAIHPDGRHLYVCNRFDDTVSVFDLESRAETACVRAVREPCASAMTPDGKRLFVLNQLPAQRSDGADVAAAITVIDTATSAASQVRLRTGSTGLRAACISPDGRRLYVVHTLARYQIPASQVDRGWMNANAMSILDTRTAALMATVLLDDPDRGAANPWAVACSAGVKGQGELICVAHGGTHELSVIRAVELMGRLAERQSGTASPNKGGNAYALAIGPDMPDELIRLYRQLANPEVADDVTFLAGLRQRIALPGEGPRGVAVAGSKVYAAEYFSDDLAVLDLRAELQPPPVDVIRLGAWPKPSVARRGEMLFHDGRICHQQWQSCATCHPDGRADGLNWDLLNDGLNNPKRTKSLLLAHATPPAMWTGVRPTAAAAVRSGLRHIQFAEIPEDDATNIDAYLKSLRPRQSPHLVEGRLSPAANRGKELFFSHAVGCAVCHPLPLYTDLQQHDVGSENAFDRCSGFDTPCLVECWRTAPYLHDGRYVTLRELLLTGKHGLSRPHAAALSEREIDDLIEFVLSL
jgi:YVTN family beta-propeller protein